MAAASVSDADVAELEAAIDRSRRSLNRCGRSFLPGGAAAAAQLHVAPLHLPAERAAVG